MWRSSPIRNPVSSASPAWKDCRPPSFDDLQQFTHRYPRVTINIEHLTAEGVNLDGLRDRAYDVALLRLDAIAGDVEADDFSLETLFTDELVIAAGLQNPLLRKRKVALAALVDEPWILSPPGYWHHKRVVEAFRKQGLELLKARIHAFTVMLRMQLLAGGPHISVFSGPVMRLYGAKFGIGAIPVEFPNRPWPVVAVTLKRQTQSPTVTSSSPRRATLLRPSSKTNSQWPLFHPSGSIGVKEVGVPAGRMSAMCAREERGGGGRGGGGGGREGGGGKERGSGHRDDLGEAVGTRSRL